MALSKEQQVMLKDMATRLRIHSVESTSKAKSGHPTSCASMAETVAVLFFNKMRQVYTIRTHIGPLNILILDMKSQPCNVHGLL